MALWSALWRDTGTDPNYLELLSTSGTPMGIHCVNVPSHWSEPQKGAHGTEPFFFASAPAAHLRVLQRHHHLNLQSNLVERKSWGRIVNVIWNPAEKAWSEAWQVAPQHSLHLWLPIKTLSWSASAVSQQRQRLGHLLQLTYPSCTTWKTMTQPSCHPSTGAGARAPSDLMEAFSNGIDQGTLQAPAEIQTPRSCEAYKTGENP